MIKIVNKITAILDKLERGALTEEELNNLVDCSAEMHEKALILRYKAYELKIYGNSENISVSIPTPEEVSEKPIIVPTIPLEKEQESASVDESISEAPTFDLSLFDEATEEVSEDNEEEISLEEEENEQSETLHEEELSLQNDHDLENNIPEPALVNVETFEEEVAEEIVIPEHMVEEPAIVEEVSNSNQALVDSDLLSKYSTIEPGFFSQLGTTKLDQLVGTFGLNERLQFINELFDGSSEAFSETIKKLDALNSYPDALSLLANAASQYNWDDADSDTIEEFMTKVKRRHG